MTNQLKSLITFICDENWEKVKQIAEHILVSDKTAKDKEFCEQMLTYIQKSKDRIEVPANCQSLVSVTDEPKISPRYSIGEREQDIFDIVHKMCGVAELLNQKQIRYNNSILLHGKPGTGKTTFANYIAAQLKLPMIYLNLSYILDSYLGKSAQNIERVFRFVNEHHCVFMLDELDAIGAQRGAHNDLGEMNRVTISLMQNIDALKSNVILIAATNRIDIIDTALLRRFIIKHEVLPPDVQEKKSIIHRFCENVDLDEDANEVQKLIETCDTQAQLESSLIQILADKLLKESNLVKRGEENV